MRRSNLRRYTFTVWLLRLRLRARAQAADDNLHIIIHLFDKFFHTFQLLYIFKHCINLYVHQLVDN